MRRREFGRASWRRGAARPLAARAQRQESGSIIGYIGGGGPITQRAWVEAFVQRLRELGWIEGRTIAIEYRWGEGSAQRYAEFAAEFVRLKVDVILAGGTEAVVGAVPAPPLIPIVFIKAGARSAAESARFAGAIRSGGHPGSVEPRERSPPPNASDFCARFSRLCGGWPRWQMSDYSGGATEREEIDAAARALGIEVIPLPIRRVEDIASSFYELKGGVEALYTTGDPIVHAHRLRIITFALVARLPTMFTQREYVASGGLLSYGPNFLELNSTRGRLCRQGPARREAG